MRSRLFNGVRLPDPFNTQDILLEMIRTQFPKARVLARSRRRTVAAKSVAKRSLPGLVCCIALVHVADVLAQDVGRPDKQQITKVLGSTVRADVTAWRGSRPPDVQRLPAYEVVVELGDTNVLRRW